MNNDNIVFDTEYLYQKSFDELLNGFYNPNTEKFRISIKEAPITFHVIRRSFPGKYKTTQTKIITCAIQRGCSILQHNEDFLEINMIYPQLIENMSEMTYKRLNHVIRYSWDTPAISQKFNVPALEWCYNMIHESHESIGLCVDQLTLACFFIGIQNCNMLNPTGTKNVNKEVAKFMDYLKQRKNI